MSLNDAELTSQELLLLELEEFVPVKFYEAVERGEKVYVEAEE